MAKLIVGTWAWGSKYPQHYIDRLQAGVARHLKQPHEFRVFTPEPEDEHLTQVPGCFARLRYFDPEWQARQGIERGDRLVCLDLDLIVTGALDPLFDVPHPFMILMGANVANPCVMNGSVWMLRAGYRPDVWTDFSLDWAKTIPHYEYPDDQAVMAYKLRHEEGWQVGPSSGIYAFKKRMWPPGDDLPKGARIVAFPGWRDPSNVEHLDWVKAHWRS